MDNSQPNDTTQEKTQNKSIIAESVEVLLQEYVTLKTRSFMEIYEMSRVSHPGLYRKQIRRTLENYYLLLRTLHILMELSKVDYPGYVVDITEKQRYIESLIGTHPLEEEEVEKVRGLCEWVDLTLLTPHLRTTLIRAEL